MRDANATVLTKDKMERTKPGREGGERERGVKKKKGGSEGRESGDKRKRTREREGDGEKETEGWDEREQKRPRERERMSDVVLKQGRERAGVLKSEREGEGKRETEGCDIEGGRESERESGFERCCQGGKSKSRRE